MASLIGRLLTFRVPVVGPKFIVEGRRGELNEQSE